VQRDGKPVPYGMNGGFSGLIDAARSSVGFGGSEPPPYGVNGGSSP